MIFLSIITILLLSTSTAYSYNRRIIGGNNITIEDAPYQVALYYSYIFVCGGSLLSRSFVLTASHCVDDRLFDHEIFTIKIGTSYSDWDHPSGLQINVEKILMNPEYDHVSVDYDFALLKLEEFGELPENVEFAKLPTPDDHLEDDEDVFITGWGITEENRTSTILRRAVVPIINIEKCEKIYVVTDRMICAGYDEGGIDACQNDSGSPLVRISDGIQFGITSFGKGCGVPGIPGVYAKVSSVLDWIHSIIN